MPNKTTDWVRYEQAEGLRNSGKTWKEVGAELGVCAQRAAQMVARLEYRRRKLAYEDAAAARAAEIEREHELWVRKEAPELRGLSTASASRLIRLGLRTRDALRFIGKAATYQEFMFLSITQGIPAVTLNEVRSWLGTEPIERPQRVVPAPRTPTPKEVRAAVRILERSGYEIRPPAGSPS